jgi:hypothetical protein
MKNLRSLLVLVGSPLALVVACGGSNDSEIFSSADDAGRTSAMPSPSGDGGSGSTDGSVDETGSQGNGNNGKKDAGTDARSDANPGVDAGSLCEATGGTVTTALCCKSVGDYPDTCKVGACGCAPGASRAVISCLCPANECYDAVLGCRAR